LFQLTEVQQAQISDWLQTLGSTDTINKLASPPAFTARMRHGVRGQDLLFIRISLR
jgi:hypothetical protein